MKKLFTICSGSKHGFLLLEVLAGLGLICLVGTFFVQGSLKFMEHLQRVQVRSELQDAGRYMLGRLERDLCISATEVYLPGDGEIFCVTNFGQCTHQYYLQNVNLTGGRGLYVKTVTRDGTGVNPLYIRDCAVAGWQVKCLSDRSLQVNFTLLKEGCRQDFAGVFPLLNGVVENEG